MGEDITRGSWCDNVKTRRMGAHLGRGFSGVFLGFFVKDIDWDLRTVKG